MESDKSLEARLRAAIQKAIAKGHWPKMSSDLKKEMESPIKTFYVRGCRVLLSTEGAQIEARSQAHADNITQYLVAEGFIPERKDEGEDWK
jgi:hypothetical protein